jgi:hypothetical protein
LRLSAFPTENPPAAVAGGPGWLIDKSKKAAKPTDICPFTKADPDPSPAGSTFWLAATTPHRLATDAAVDATNQSAPINLWPAEKHKGRPPLDGPLIF